MGGKRTGVNPNAGLLGGRRNNHGKLGKLPPDDGSQPRFVERTPGNAARKPQTQTKLSLDSVVLHEGKVRFASQLRAMITALDPTHNYGQTDQRTLAQLISQKVQNNGGLRTVCLNAIKVGGEE